MACTCYIPQAIMSCSTQCFGFFNPGVVRVNLGQGKHSERPCTALTASKSIHSTARKQLNVPPSIAFRKFLGHNEIFYMT